MIIHTAESEHSSPGGRGSIECHCPRRGVNLAPHQVPCVISYAGKLTSPASWEQLRSKQGKRVSESSHATPLDLRERSASSCCGSSQLDPPSLEPYSAPCQAWREWPTCRHSSSAAAAHVLAQRAQPAGRAMHGWLSVHSYIFLASWQFAVMPPSGSFLLRYKRFSLCPVSSKGAALHIFEMRLKLLTVRRGRASLAEEVGSPGTA